MQHSDNAGTEAWKRYMDVLRAAAAQGARPLLRGAGAVGSYPLNGEMSQLPRKWEPDASHASHVVYHYGTPVAWIDDRDGMWVVPAETYSPTTSGVQNRIRARLEGIGYRTEPQAAGDQNGDDDLETVEVVYEVTVRVGVDDPAPATGHLSRAVLRNFPQGTHVHVTRH